MSKSLNPLSGYPKTVERNMRSGEKRFTAKPRACGPIRANIADKLTIASTGTACVAAVVTALSATELPTLSRWAIMAAPLPLHFLFQTSWHFVLGRTVSVVFTPQTIGVRKFVLTKRFDRNVPIKFILRQHPRAARQDKIIEHRRIDPEAPRRFLPQRNYYAESYILSIEVMGQAYDIQTIYGHTRAQRVCARLNAIHNSIDAFSGSGKGIAASPEQDWAKAAGELS